MLGSSLSRKTTTDNASVVVSQGYVVSLIISPEKTSTILAIGAVNISKNLWHVQCTSRGDAEALIELDDRTPIYLV